MPNGGAHGSWSVGDIAAAGSNRNGICSAAITRVVMVVVMVVAAVPQKDNNIDVDHVVIVLGIASKS
jgi:hypothetical protein